MASIHNSQFTIESLLHPAPSTGCAKLITVPLAGQRWIAKKRAPQQLSNRPNEWRKIFLQTCFPVSSTLSLKNMCFNQTKSLGCRLDFFKRRFKALIYFPNIKFMRLKKGCGCFSKSDICIQSKVWQSFELFKMTQVCWTSSRLHGRSNMAARYGSRWLSNLLQYFNFMSCLKVIWVVKLF